MQAKCFTIRWLPTSPLFATLSYCKNYNVSVNIIVTNLENVITSIVNHSLTSPLLNYCPICTASEFLHTFLKKNAIVQYEMA